MSGGHWGYKRERLQERGEEMRRLFFVLGEVEHAMDWTICCDWGAEEGPAVVWQLMEDYFDGKPGRTADEVLTVIRREAKVKW